AAVFIAVALGAWLTRPALIPAAASSMPSTNAVPTAPAQFAVPATSSAPKTQVDHSVVYFARDGLPPVGYHVGGIAADPSPAGRIAQRLTVLARNADLSKFADHDRVLPSTFNAFPVASQVRILSSAVVKVDADIATVA